MQIRNSDIQILPSEVINQIAAGEVLERPANLVKELIENSLDAGANEIEIDLDLGGRYIKVQDNGVGMEKKDLSLALGRHSTSKIRKFSDLWSLSTYGFRGEALASIAAVSQMSIVTKPEKSNIAYKMTSHFGGQSDVHEVSGNYGTQIVVEDLFANVPARLKFLKSDVAEVTQITKTLKAFALTQPKVSFRFKQKGLLKIFYPATDSYLERAKLVFEEKELFEVEQKYSHFQVRLIYSSPQKVNKTAQNIWIFAQRRWVQDRGIQKAVMDGYRNLLMHGEYPYCAAYLECDPQLIDVNIHPTKSQVKFQDSSTAFLAVHNTLKENLEKAPWLKNLFQNDDTSSQQDSISTALDKFSRHYELQTQFQEQRQHFEQTVYPQKKYSLEPVANFHATLKEEVVGGNQNLQNERHVFGDPLWGSLQVLGQLNLTYIVAQSRHALFLVDQHAAHERVAFERLMKSYRENHFEIQNNLIPLQIDFDPDKFEAIVNLSDSLKKMGIEIEAAGPQTISVNSAPGLVKEKALIEILQKMAVEFLDAGGSFSLEKKVSDLFATMACHSVVRAGQALSLEEMKELLLQMDEFPSSSFCPHGRPVFKQITFRELDKEFGRIV